MQLLLIWITSSASPHRSNKFRDMIWKRPPYVQTKPLILKKATPTEVKQIPVDFSDKVIHF